MKKIGIPGWVLDSKAFGVGITYAEYIRQFGQLIIINPDDPVRDDLDLLILPGGADISPHQHSNSTLSLYTGTSNPMLEYFDNTQLQGYIDNNTPIIGICRGAQKLWSLFGGAFIQHNYTHSQSKHSKDEAHPIHFIGEYSEYKGAIWNVTSRHHQTMSVLKESEVKIPDSLDVIAYAAEHVNKKVHVYHDIVEVFKVKDKNIYGFQYHPEDMTNDRFTPFIIKTLLQ